MSTPLLATSEPEALAYSVAETATRLGISEKFAWQMVHKGQLPAVRLGSRTLIPVARLRSWLETEYVPQTRVPAVL